MQAPELTDYTPELHQALHALEGGLLIGLPTETVYGLGADATNPNSVAAIFASKGRPQFNPLISHVATTEAAMREGDFSSLAQRLANAFWPGPLTLVVPRRPSSNICDLACAGLETVALRVPAHNLTLQLLTAFGRPVAAPSANVSGRPSSTTADHVRAEFGDKVTYVLDGGPCGVGLESTVIAVIGDQATLLRLGGLTRHTIEVISGALKSPNQSDLSAPASPGMMLRHYAPNSPIRMNQTSSGHNGILIGFGDIQDNPTFNLSQCGNLTEAATNFFAILRAVDAQNPKTIAVAPIPDEGLGEAINDRLTRAVNG